MRQSQLSVINGTRGAVSRSLGIFASIFLLMASAQVLAQDEGQICNSSLNLYNVGPGTHSDPIFLGDTVTAVMTITAGGNNTAPLNVPTFGFAADCQFMPSGLNYDNCVGQGNSINFLGSIDVGSTCKNSALAEITFPTPTSSFIDFIPDNGPIYMQPDSSCTIRWDYEVVEFAPGGEAAPKSGTLFQVADLPLSEEAMSPDPWEGPAHCKLTNDEPYGRQTSSTGPGRLTIDECGIEIKKQICLPSTGCDSEDDWHDADDEALPLGSAGEAAYRVIMTNTGTVAYQGQIKINDPKLGINDQYIDWVDDDGNPGTMTIGGIDAQIDLSHTCRENGTFENIFDVEAWCRSETGRAPYSAVHSNNALASCTNIVTQSPALSLVKTASPKTYDTVGQTINYSYKLTNTGTGTLYQPFTIDDDKSIDESCPNSPASLATGEFITCTATYKITEADLIAGSVTNKATGTGYDESQQPVDSNEDEETVTAVAADLEVEKSAELKTLHDDGSIDVEYTVKVKNTGGQSGTYDLVDKLEVDEALVLDSIVANVSYVAGTDGTVETPPELKSPVKGDFLTGATLVAGATIAGGKDESYKFTLKFTLDGTKTTVEGSDCEKEVNEDNTGLTNHVDLKVGGQVVDFDKACDEFPLDPDIELTKKISLDGQSYSSKEGPVEPPSGAYYQMIVKNTGNIVLDEVRIIDPMICDETETDPNESDYCYTFGPLAVGEMVTITFDTGPDANNLDLGGGAWPALDVDEVCSYTALKENVAVAVGEYGPDDDTVQDDGKAELDCVGDPLVVIQKQVKVGDSGWQDADEPEDYPVVGYDGFTPVPAEYRLIIGNSGSVNLVNVVVNDSKLWNGDKTVNGGTLSTAEVGVIIDKDDIPELEVDNVCEVLGNNPNLAEVKGTDENDPNAQDSATNPAGVKCVAIPGISVLKEVAACDINSDDFSDDGSSDGDDSSGDGPSDDGDSDGDDDSSDDDDSSGDGGSADDGSSDGDDSSGDGVSDDDSSEGGQNGENNCDLDWSTSVSADSVSDAYWRFTIKNEGNDELTNVMVVDNLIGINQGISNLDVDETVVITHQAPGFSKLYWPEYCDSTFSEKNKVTVSADSVGDGPSVQAEAEAEFICNDDPNLCSDGIPTALWVQYDADDDTDYNKLMDPVTIDPSKQLFPQDRPVHVYIYGIVGNTELLLLDDDDVNPDDLLKIASPPFSIPKTIKIEIWDDTGGDDGSSDDGSGDDTDDDSSNSCDDGSDDEGSGDEGSGDDDSSGGSCGPKLLQTIIFDTSCTKPLDEGDELGAITLWSAEY